MSEAREGESPTEFAIRMVKEDAEVKLLVDLYTEIVSVYDHRETRDFYRQGLYRASRMVYNRLRDRGEQDLVRDI